MGHNGWRNLTLGAVAVAEYGLVDGPFGSSLPASCYVLDGVPVIRGSNLSLGESRFKVGNFVFVSEKTAKRLSRSICVADDIIFTKKGTLGQTGIIPNDTKFPKFLLSSNQMKLTVSRDIADPLFVYYYVSSPASREKIVRESTASGVPKINVAYLRQFPIKLPPLNEQHAIARILGALDAKIELNRQMNQTLEAIAQARYKSWFVDFEPVTAKAAGRNPYGMSEETAALFPEQFQETELGLTPEGWEIIPIGTLFRYVIGGDWGMENHSLEFSEHCAVIRGTDFEDLDNGKFSRVPRRFIKAVNFQKRELVHGDIIIEISGGSRDQPTGRSLFITNEVINELGGQVVPASFCRLVRPANLEAGYYLRMYLTLLYKSGGTWNYQLQSTGISNFQFPYFSEKEMLALPSDKLLKTFREQIEPIIKLAASNSQQIRTLGDVRDMLLPRLLSGEIRVREAEREVEQVV